MAAKKTAAETETAAETAFAERTVSCPGYSGLNVREKPSAAAKVVAVVPHGFKVMAAEPKRGWCEVRDGGYAKADYLV